ncbi:MAG: peptidoglycan-binding protein [Candidatus Nanopelagicales bacterium]|nr:peptidoglycan-binding protein [Candidatus Nanopelagicales bacterium]MDZ4248799.1 peptidoglycan-binding protein [Candidatus Nanopelagicales bacterium]
MTGLVFRLGDRGPAVAEIRARLARLGLLPGSLYAEEHRDDDPLRSGPSEPQEDPSLWETTGLVSADFDTEVETAVREFQRRRGITADGVVGPETFRRLEEARWRLGDRILCYGTPHTTVGEDILDLQQRLNALGFSCGREDGRLGPLTDRAIHEFQRNTGIGADGVCGPSTFRALGQLRRTVGHYSSQSVREKYSLHELRTGVRGKLVVLDPCVRDMPDPGSPQATEAAITAAIAARIEVHLNEIGARVLVTRSLFDPPSASTTVEDRARMCNELGADLVLSIGVSHNPDHPGGPATYFWGREQGTQSLPGRLAANLISEGITDLTGTPGRGSSPRTSDLLRLTRMPAVRIELGNLMQPGDRQKLADAAVTEAVARSIAKSVERFFEPEPAV